MYGKMSFAKWRLFGLGLNVFTTLQRSITSPSTTLPFPVSVKTNLLIWLATKTRYNKMRTVCLISRCFFYQILYKLCSLWWYIRYMRPGMKYSLFYLYWFLYIFSVNTRIILHAQSQWETMLQYNGGAHAQNNPCKYSHNLLYKL